jgi:outer membrane protein assembly factor BamB
MATEGQHLVAFFGSEGLYCYDLEGRLLWSRDLGVINISKYAIIWDSAQGGSYIATPVVYGDYIYFGNPNGVVRCFASKTGKKIYEERLSPDASVYASLVAADGKIFCASEDGDVYVLKAGPEFQIISRNRLGGPCYATPAISEGVLYFRTTDSLIAAGA